MHILFIAIECVLILIVAVLFTWLVGRYCKGNQWQANKFGLFLLIFGMLGLLIVAIQFAGQFPPSMKHLPLKDTFTRQEVVSEIIFHIQNISWLYIFAVFFGVVEILGGLVLVFKNPV